MSEKVKVIGFRLFGWTVIRSDRLAAWSNEEQRLDGLLRRHWRGFRPFRHAWFAGLHAEDLDTNTEQRLNMTDVEAAVVGRDRPPLSLVP